MSKKKGRTQIRVRPSLRPGLRTDRARVLPITNHILSSKWAVQQDNCWA